MQSSPSILDEIRFIVPSDHHLGSCAMRFRGVSRLHHQSHRSRFSITHEYFARFFGEHFLNEFFPQTSEGMAK